MNTQRILGIFCACFSLAFIVSFAFTPQPAKGIGGTTQPLEQCEDLEDALDTCLAEYTADIAACNTAYNTATTACDAAHENGSVDHQNCMTAALNNKTNCKDFANIELEACMQVAFQNFYCEDAVNCAESPTCTDHCDDTATDCQDLEDSWALLCSTYDPGPEKDACVASAVAAVNACEVNNDAKQITCEAETYADTCS